MEPSRHEYPALLTSLQPVDAANVLNSRIKHISQITGDVADWIAERRKVEDAYVLGLRKLAASRPENSSILGVFREPWHAIIGSCESYADSHSTFAKKIGDDVEKPLREFTGKGKELQAITTTQGNLQSLAKDVDDAKKKSDKQLARGDKADSSRLAHSLSNLQAATNHWESQAPYVFELLQALDESRVNRLRDVLTQLQTHEVDQLERNRSVAEGTLNSVLTIDTSEEISTFVAAVTQGAPSLQARRTQSSRHSRTLSVGSTGPPATAQSGESVPPIPEVPPSLPPVGSTLAPPATGEDDRSEASGETSERRAESRAGPPPTPSTEKKKGGIGGGLRRLGTVMSRRNKGESKPPPVTPTEKKPKSRRNPLRRGSSSRNSMYQLNSPGASATELADTSAGQRPAELPQEHQTTTRQNASDKNGLAAAPNGTASIPEPPPPRKPRPLSTMQEETSSPTTQFSPSATQGTQGAQRDEIQAGPSTGGPSSAIDDITRAQQEADAVSNDQPQFKLDIKNEPIQEEGSEQALSNVANTLRAGALPPPRRANTLRGRRDVRNTVFVPNNTPPENALAGPSDTLAPLAASPAGRSSEDHRGADTMSIRSAHSLVSMSHGAVRHADMHEPGLNASIVETISASFSGGAVIKALAIGEVALVYNKPAPAPGAPPTPAPNSEHIRLENFAVLEKVAPNPALVNPIPGKNGEYTADMAALGKSQVAFKYQVHLDEAKLAAHAPVLLTPTWKVEANQTSVILSYAFNPEFSSPSKSVALGNFAVAISLDGSSASGKAISCQSKPQGTFSREKNLVYWRLGDIALTETHEGPPLRLLARFATEGGEAKPGKVEARWEMTGDGGSGLGLSLRHGGPRAEGAEPGDPFADGSSSSATGDSNNGWKECKVHRRLVSGKYIAN